MLCVFSETKVVLAISNPINAGKTNDSGFSPLWVLFVIPVMLETVHIVYTIVMITHLILFTCS